VGAAGVGRGKAQSRCGEECRASREVLLSALSTTSQDVSPKSVYVQWSYALIVAARAGGSGSSLLGLDLVCVGLARVFCGATQLPDIIETDAAEGAAGNTSRGSYFRAVAFRIAPRASSIRSMQNVQCLRHGGSK
jgi:hypothetical protein